MELQEQRPKKAVWHYVEFELYNYKNTRQELEEMREDILTDSPFCETSVQSGPGNSTAAKAEKLLSSKVLNRMSKTVLAIDRALKMLSEDHNSLFELKYTEGKSWQIVCMELPCSRATYFNIRKDVILMVAQEMGHN